MAAAIAELLLQRQDGSAVVELYADPEAPPLPLDALIAQARLHHSHAKH